MIGNSRPLLAWIVIIWTASASLSRRRVRSCRLPASPALRWQPLDEPRGGRAVSLLRHLVELPAHVAQVGHPPLAVRVGQHARG